MNRRTLLAGLAVPLGGGAAVAGRLDHRRDKTFAIRSPPPVEGYRFELVDADDRFDDGEHDPEGRFAHGAEVEFDPAGNRVRVLGRVKSGGRSCRETELGALRYDESSGALTVVVFDDYVHHDACTAEIAAVPYAVSVGFESTVPSSVTVKHVADRDGIVYEETFRE